MASSEYNHKNKNNWSPWVVVSACVCMYLLYSVLVILCLYLLYAVPTCYTRTCSLTETGQDHMRGRLPKGHLRRNANASSFEVDIIHSFIHPLHAAAAAAAAL